MSVNTAHTPDGRGVLIYNGEMILVFIKEVVCHFENHSDPVFKSKKNGNLYLTSHRVIFINQSNDTMRSFSMPFHCMKDVKLEQPVFGANYLKGVAIAQPGGNWNGEVIWKLSFNKGGCIDIGQALLKANEMARHFRPYNAPPAYAPPPGNFYAAPPSYYIPAGAGNVYMYEAPPPYSGIGPDQPPVPAGQLASYGNSPSAPPPNGSQQAPPLPPKI